MADAEQSARRILMGRFTGLFGVRGWLKVASYCDPPENILDYGDCWVKQGESWQSVRFAEGKRHGKGLIVRLEGCEDRDAAAAWIGADIAVERARLGEPEDGSFYWADLVGLEVMTVEGRALGQVERLFATGANDVVVVQGDRERLIPWLVGDVIKSVDLAGGCIQVDWDADF